MIGYDQNMMQSRIQGCECMTRTKNEIIYVLPFKIESKANQRTATCYQSATIAKEQRKIGHHITRSAMHRNKFYPGCTVNLKVKLIRVSPRSLDSDNLPHAFKNYRDGIADALERKNDDKFFTWEYEQVPSKENCAIVKISIEGKM